MSEKSRTSRLLCIVNTLRKRNWRERTFTICVLCATTAIALPAQTFTTLHSFDGTDGAGPVAGLVQGTDGNLYGTTFAGGSNAGSCSAEVPEGCGTIFKITPSGTLTTLYTFCAQSGCTDGANPYAGLVQGTNGDFYGTTWQGGSSNLAGCYGLGCGTVFKITPSGTLTTLYNFCSESGCADGELPLAGLVQATNGYLYGTTSSGGANGGGTVFKITPTGTLTTQYSFCSQGGALCTDGAKPSGALVQATNGDFYGTTFVGGANNDGTVFKIPPNGSVTTLHSFDGADGESPYGALVQANGNFYGTTYYGGTVSIGTVFKITASGTLTTLHSFTLHGNPLAGLVQGTNGDFYGTTYGTIFKITPSGRLTTLYMFCSQTGCTDGSSSHAPLVQATNGDFYGTTVLGGANDTCPSGCGTVFSLSLGLGAFVETQPTSGKVGSAVKILGTNLTGATSVTFKGTAAVFTVKSASEITTTVPTGATTGTVQVVTPSGTLSSNVAFRVP
jgi:uncharacterized repeat protein (TIGR03803 family)